MKTSSFKVMGGIYGDKESGYFTSIGTNGGLTTENRFDPYFYGTVYQCKSY
jgi:hypothetical protein